MERLRCAARSPWIRWSSSPRPASCSGSKGGKLFFERLDSSERGLHRTVQVASSTLSSRPSICLEATAHLDDLVGTKTERLDVLLESVDPLVELAEAGPLRSEGDKLFLERLDSGERGLRGAVGRLVDAVQSSVNRLEATAHLDDLVGNGIERLDVLLESLDPLVELAEAGPLRSEGDKLFLERLDSSERGLHRTVGRFVSAVQSSVDRLEATAHLDDLVGNGVELDSMLLESLDPLVELAKASPRSEVSRSSITWRHSKTSASSRKPAIVAALSLLFQRLNPLVVIMDANGSK